MGGPYVFNVQRFSVHDGPGLRSTIFFKGCPMDCPWCHNPEAKAFGPEPLTGAEGRIELVGRLYSVDELVAEVVKDVMLYDQSGGGVTFSGGEVMAMPDFDFVLELARRLTSRGISVGVDTCGLAATERFVRMAEYAEFFLYDLKFIDDTAHSRWTGVSNRLVLKNLEVLAGLGATIDLRMILLEGLNTSPDDIELTMQWLAAHGVRPRQVNLLPYHRFGQDKRVRLGLEATSFAPPGEERLEAIRRHIEQYVASVGVGG